MWVRLAETDQEVPSDRERLKELERENRELKRANEILRMICLIGQQIKLTGSL